MLRRLGRIALLLTVLSLLCASTLTHTQPTHATIADRLSAADWQAIQTQLPASVQNTFAKQEAYLKASDPGSLDNFGASIALSGDTVVVGALGQEESDADQNSGAAYVFTRVNGMWMQQAYLKAPKRVANDGFGWSVAISGDTIVIGAPYTDISSSDGPGAAYVFVRNNGVWTQQAQLVASNYGIGDAFGWSVAISGNTIIVGAPGESSDATGLYGDQNNNNAPWAGAAYIFTRITSTGVWKQQAYLKASNTEKYDQFGWSVAASDDTVVVGAWGEDSDIEGFFGFPGNYPTNNNALDAGATYVFLVGSLGLWVQQAYLKASNTDAGDHFGWSVSISDNTIVVGAPLEDSDDTYVGGSGNNAAPDAGAAYVIVRKNNQWAQQAYLKSLFTEAGDQFGWSVGVSGTLVVVGANLKDINAAGTFEEVGEAFIFGRKKGVWSQWFFCAAYNNLDSHDLYGVSAAIGPNFVAIGAMNEDSNASGVNGDTKNNSALDAGAAYILTDIGIHTYLPAVIR